MKKHLTILVLVVLSAFTSNVFAQDFNGFTLYNNQNSATAYLLDEDGEIAHSWSCNVNANYALFLKDDGNLIRQGVVSGAQLDGAAAGGIIQELDKDANIVWEFTYSTADYRSHHDFAVMPNGNVLLVAWEVKTATEMTAAGYNSSTEKWPTHIIEVQQNGTGGEIVWEWHMWDHLIQDTDQSKPNYGVIADHPELMDINVPTSTGGRPGRGGDWFHVNGIDYNADLDQIVFSSRLLSEIMIIDHSTTTAEAAGHSGGNAGKGGDILFRYGNPSNYGSTGTQVIAGACHDARWIKDDGRPNGGYIQFFNNVGGTGGSSVVDAINPLRDGYNYTFTDGSYSPTSHDWRHECLDDADGQSASDRLSNGNIFVALSKNYMYEVTESGTVVWQYNDGPPKAFRYECEHDGIKTLLDNPCEVSSVEGLSENAITLYPNPTNGKLFFEGLNETANFKVIDVLGQEVINIENANTIDVSSLSKGNYMVEISIDNQILRKNFILN